MQQVQMLRALLVAGAALAVVVAAFAGAWPAALILGLGVVAHGVYTVRTQRPPSTRVRTPR